MFEMGIKIKSINNIDKKIHYAIENGSITDLLDSVSGGEIGDNVKQSINEAVEVGFENNTLFWDNGYIIFKEATND